MLVLSWLNLAGVCVGHIAILSLSLNWWFGHALPHPLLSAIRLLHGALVLAGVAAFGWSWGIGSDLVLQWHYASTWDIAAISYARLCAIVGLIFLPWITLVRRLRPVPKALIASQNRVVDFAKELGYKPLGRGRFRWMAQFPFNQIYQVEFSEHSFCLPRVPAAWDGLTILHLTDLHFHGTPDREFFQKIMDQCRSWQPDIVAITGDIVDSDWHHRWILPLLGKLRSRYGSFAILGNHDKLRDPVLIRRRLKRLGIRVLDNMWEHVDVRGEPMIVIGHEGPWFVPPPDLHRCPADVFRLCLSHTPDNMPWARQMGIDLVLAGHVHGGQIRFPLIGSVLVPSRFSRKYDCGVFYEAPTLLHVSRGISGQHPLRYNCRPEVTKITLRAASATRQ